MSNIGNVYIAEKSNHRIRKVTVATSNPRYVDNSIFSNFYYFFDFYYKFNFSSPSPSTIPSQTPSLVPSDTPSVIPTLALTATPSYYPSVSPNSISIITTFAGTGTGAFSGDGDQATSASIYHPAGIAFDSSGNVFFSDDNNQRIRKITASTGIITTYAGTGAAGFSGDNGQATSATFYYPEGLAIDSSGQYDNFRHTVGCYL